MHSLRRIPYWGFLALLVYMPFHVFLSQSLSLATGGLEAWKIGKDVVLAIVVLFAICLVWKQGLFDGIFTLLLGLATAYAAIHLVVWLFQPEIYQQSAILGFVYNTRLPALLLLGFCAARLNQDKFTFSSVFTVVISVSTCVAGLGVLQYFLPPDLLSHAGYSLERGVHAAFFIDNNPALPRIMSTLREPNSLGAYLVLPIAALTTGIFVQKTNPGRRYLFVGLLLLHLLALFLTFSRSAWLAAALAIGLILLWLYKDVLWRLRKRLWLPAALLLISLAVGLFTLRHSAVVETYIVHVDDPVAGEQSSTDHHYLYLRQAVAGVVAQPLGHGPGTAGPTSLHNPAGAQITENYYLQIAYEVGVVGLLIFIGLLVVVYLRIWRRHDAVTVVLIASFWGYAVANMFLHTWANEAVAAQWWLLAGAAVALGGKSAKNVTAKNATF